MNTTLLHLLDLLFWNGDVDGDGDSKGDADGDGKKSGKLSITIRTRQEVK